MHKITSLVGVSSLINLKDLKFLRLSMNRKFCFHFRVTVPSVDLLILNSSETTIKITNNHLHINK